MPGELWRGAFQYGVETTYGSGVAATRKAYFRPDSRLSREQEPRPHRFMTGTRDNVRGFTVGPQTAGGSVSLPLSYDEIVELALVTINGGVTPSTVDTSARLWVFTPGTTLNSMTLEWDDAGNAWEANGVYGNSLRIAGSAQGENLLTCDLFAKQLVTTTMTPALASRTPTFLEGWETKVYIDAFGGTAGTTVVTGQLINWDVSFTGNLGRKYFADNTNATGAVTVGEIQVEATLTFEAAGAQVDTEFTNWTGATKRLVRLEFGNNVLVGAVSAKGFVTVDLPGAWSAFDLGGEDAGTRVYELRLQYVMDPVNAYGFQLRAQNARATAFGA